MNRLKNIFTLILFFTTISLCFGQTRSKLECLDKKFSIAVHVVTDSLNKAGVAQAEVQAGIDLLNKAFKPICVSFEMCELDTIKNFLYDKFDKDKDSAWVEMKILYNRKNRINIYYVKEILQPAKYNGISGFGLISNMDSCSMLIKKNPKESPNYMVHEMGHLFGLDDTFEELKYGPELVDGSNSAFAGDKIADTPADPFVLDEGAAAYVNTSCKVISMKKDAKGKYYIPDVANFMSYYAACSCEFTDGQYNKMVATYKAGRGIW